MQQLRLPFAFLVVTYIQLTTTLVAPEIKDTLDIIHDIDVLVKTVRSNIADSEVDTDAADVINIRENQNIVLNQFKNIDEQINRTLRQSSHNELNVLETISDFIADDAVADVQFNELTDMINKISMRYDEILAYERRKESVEMNTLISFAEWSALPNAHSVSHSMERLHLMLFGRVTDEANVKSTLHTLLGRIMKIYGSSSEVRCRIILSPQQFLYALYTEIAHIELKGYILIELAMKLLRDSGLGNFTSETAQFRLNHERRTQHGLNMLRLQMQQADNFIWRCDPHTHVAKVTYDVLTRLLQGYIENEDGLNADRTCRRTCAAYQDTKVSGCIGDSFCDKQPPCTGRVHDCRFIASKMWVCQSPHSSDRRYEYIQYEDGQLLGKKNNCGHGSTKVDSWWRWIFWHCSFCFCLCDEQGIKSDRYFNLRETLADVAANKVVTGVRFVKHNRIFHLQIQQGQLLTRGAINASTVEWKPVDNYQIYHHGVNNGVDYHTMSYQSRGIDLADVTKTDDKTFVVTGLRFRLYRGRLNLQLRYSKFDFDSGKLNESVWVRNEKSGDRLDIQNRDLPTNSWVSSQSVLHENHYLEFVNTGLYEDAAQTTIPFIDIQDVASNCPAPLHGIGLYYKGTPGYGGFVAPIIFNYDFAPHVGMPLNQKLD